MLSMQERHLTLYDIMACSTNYFSMASLIIFGFSFTSGIRISGHQLSGVISCPDRLLFDRGPCFLPYFTPFILMTFLSSVLVIYIVVSWRMLMILPSGVASSADMLHP